MSVRKTKVFRHLDEAFESWPDLLDPHLPNLYWSDVNSVEAKQRWVEPDLVPMP